MELTSPDGTPITVRPIEREDLGRILLRCLPDGGTIEELFVDQGTIGMAAWEGDRCVGQVHCYRVVLPDGKNENWPEHSRWMHEPAWWREASRTAGFGLSGPTWCHACFHVGRTLETGREESAPSEQAKGIYKGVDTSYLGRGIGTALCQESVRWARRHDYAIVAAPGVPAGLRTVAAFAGSLPYTTYAKMGFTAIAPEGGWEDVVGPDEVEEEVRAALANGRPKSDFGSWMMALDLKHVATGE
jgi:GNAT superfamily N-acetyltransferase